MLSVIVEPGAVQFHVCVLRFVGDSGAAQLNTVRPETRAACRCASNAAGVAVDEHVAVDDDVNTAVVAPHRPRGDRPRTPLHRVRDRRGIGPRASAAASAGARVSALAGPNDVLVSSTLRDLVIGSGLDFEERGAHALKGVGRTVHGLVMPYGVTATVSDGMAPYKERFQFGAFTRSIAERGQKIRLFTGHETNRLPIGRATELTERYDGLHGAFLVAKTRDGDDALALVAAEIADAFSVGFRPIRDYDDHGVTVRTEAALMEVSLVGIGAYETAHVAGIRSAPPPGTIPRSIAEARLRLATRGR